MDIPVLADQQERMYISSLRTQNVVWKTCREQWTIGMDEERERVCVCVSGKSLLSERLDDEYLLAFNGFFCLMAY